MAWEISWLGDTREQLQLLARERLSKLQISRDIGQIAIDKVEEEIRLHPLPSPDLPQISAEELFNFGPVQVSYHIDSRTGRAEVRKVAVL